MNQQAKRIKELFGYARTLTKEQGIGTMCVRAAGFFQTALFSASGRGTGRPTWRWKPSAATPRRKPSPSFLF